MISFDKAKEYAPVFVRIGMALVFLWFSLNQFISTNEFVGFIPNFLVNWTGMSPAVFVIGNAVLEFIFGVFLLLGIHVRVSSLILAAHLLGISSSLGYGPVMIRDLGLTIATFSIFLNGRDKLCLKQN